MEHQLQSDGILSRWRGWIRVAVVVLWGAGVIVPAMIYGFPAGADFNNHFRHVQHFYDQLCAGHFDPGWFAESNNGFGDARFRFYPPAIYYLLAAGRSLTGDWYTGSLLTFTLISVAGGLGVYYWCRQISTPQLAALAGALYALAPFHLNEFYQASLLAEFAACAALPFAFAFTHRICGSGGRARAADVAGLGAAYALLVLTNLPLTVIGSLSLALYACLLTSRKRAAAALAGVASGVALGLLASSWYWVRMFSELSLVQAGGSYTRPYYDYRNNFVFSPYALTNLNTWSASILALATIGFFLPAISLLRRERRIQSDAPRTGSPSLGRSLLALAVLFGVSFLMATDLSRPLWLVIPKLEKVQFPFRWLALTSMAGCPLLALSLPRWLARAKSHALRPLNLIVAVCFFLSVAFLANNIVREAAFLSRPEFTQLLVDVRGGISFNDWLPRGAQDAGHLLPMQGLVAAGDRRVSIAEWSPEKRTFQLGPGASTTVRIRSYYYPHWRATESSDGITPVKVRLRTMPDADGSLLVMLGPNPANDNKTITVEFVEPPRTIYSYLTSLTGAALIFALGLARHLTWRGRKASLSRTAVEFA